MNRPGYIDVDKLQAETTIEAAAAKCGMSLSTKGSGAEVRIDCPFGCAGDHSSRKEIAINTENPQKIFMCHGYACGGFRGNLLTLMHGFLTGAKPSGEKLKGEEFQRVKAVLAATAEAAATCLSKKQPVTSETGAPPPQANTALIDATDERVRELHHIDQKFVTDVSRMNPAAAAYVRRHPCLSSESMKKWRCGYLPHDGGGDKRGWSLRGSIVYPVLSETGTVLAWAGRDVQYDQKERDFARLTPAERAEKEPPAKHRFPKGFHRGLELFGQHASRLMEPGYREFLAKYSLIICEGFNDVIGLDTLGIPAVGIMSNKITLEQVAKIERYARQLAGGRVTLLFDADAAGDNGAKEAAWQLLQRGLHVRLGWTQTMHGAAFRGRQPETLTRDEWERIICPTTTHEAPVTR